MVFTSPSRYTVAPHAGNGRSVSSLPSQLTFAPRIDLFSRNARTPVDAASARSVFPVPSGLTFPSRTAHPAADRPPREKTSGFGPVDGRPVLSAAGRVGIVTVPITRAARVIQPLARTSPPPRAHRIVLSLPGFPGRHSHSRSKRTVLLANLICSTCWRSKFVPMRTCGSDTNVAIA